MNMMTNNAPTSHAAAIAAPARRPPHVCVYASQVAACIGRNKHRPASEAAMLMWERMDPSGFVGALWRNGMQREEDVMCRLVDSNEEIRGLVARSMHAAGSSTEVAQRYQEAREDLGAIRGLGEDNRELVNAALRKNLYTSYGNRAEHEMLGHIREVMQIPCHADPTTYKKHMGDIDGTPWYIGGQIDALADDGSAVIEIKNRVNHLFGRVPVYERLQVQTYLELLDLDRGLVVECLKEGHVVRTGVMCVPRDRDEWGATVVPVLREFVAFVLRLVGDPALQDEFLTSKRRNALMSAVTTTATATATATPQAPLPEK